MLMYLFCKFFLFESYPMYDQTSGLGAVFKDDYDFFIF
jgi:hypothetical protein